MPRLTPEQREHAVLVRRAVDAVDGVYRDMAGDLQRSLALVTITPESRRSVMRTVDNVLWRYFGRDRLDALRSPFCRLILWSVMEASAAPPLRETARVRSIVKRSHPTLWEAIERAAGAQTREVARRRLVERQYRAFGIAPVSGGSEAAPRVDPFLDIVEMLTGQHVTEERLARAGLFDPQRRWVDGDTLRLSDRVWRARKATRDEIDAVITDGIKQGTSADRIAKNLSRHLQAGQGRSAARRLARTEVTQAHGAATVKSAAIIPGVIGVKWMLSARHPHPDECDDKARRSSKGMERGVYLPSEVPRYPTHPNDLCTLAHAHMSRQETLDEIVAKYGEVEPAGSALANTPAGEPVSGALTVPKGKLKPDMDRALAAIDKVHGDGPLPKIPVQWTRGERTVASYNYMIGGKAKHITVSTKGRRPALDFVHEVGHFLDHKGLPSVPGRFATGTGDPDTVRMMAGWKNAVENSKAAQELKALYGAAGTDFQYVRYLAGYDEMWARSYAQYVATKSGDEVLLGQLNHYRKVEEYGPTYPIQWSDEDFRPIMEAMDELFRDIEWIA